METVGASPNTGTLPDRRRFTYRQILALVALSAALFIGGMDTTLLNVALPELISVLNANTAETVWTVNSYTLTIAATIVTLATISTWVGRKRTFIIGLTGFAIASFAAAFARSPVEVIVLRCAQGIFAAALMATSIPLLSAIFTEPIGRRLAVSIWTASASLGAALGPVIGGILLQHFWWGANFLVNVPVAVGAAAIGWVYLDEAAGSPRPVDLINLACSVVGIGGLSYALQSLSDAHLRNSLSVVAIPVSVIAIGAFVYRQLRSRTPTLQLHLFRNAGFAAATIAVMASWGFYGAAIFSMTQYHQLAAGKTPLAAGLLIVPLALSCTFGAIATPRLLNRFAPSAALAMALAADCAGFLTMSALNLSLGYYAIIVVGISTGVAAASGTTLMVESARIADQPDVGAIQETAFALGSGSGVALIGLSIALVSDRVGGADVTAAVTREVATRFSYLLPASTLLVIALLVWMTARRYQPITDQERTSP
ncbi:MFS transporter [Nocardia sp. NPDC050175]|uniref:MFS transporter n=1 Tax=Nocardia sp. NPDC050175 TaxID=3364317 RepID=UPI003792C333